MIRLRNSILKMDDAQNLHRDEMMRVFRDVDGLKKHQQVAEREQLKMQRDIAVIKYFIKIWISCMDFKKSINKLLSQEDSIKNVQS